MKKAAANRHKFMEMTKDWQAVETARVLVVGENATLQWSDEVIDYVMFLDYFFRPKPFDHGERSRYNEAESILRCVSELSAGRYGAESVAATNLSMSILQRPPKGKHLLIPQKDATDGVERIKKILTDSPTIETLFVMSIQANYWLQKLGLYAGEEVFLHGAEPRRVGAQNRQPYYQPVDAKVFNDVCGRVYKTKIGTRTINVVPILPAKDYPLYGVDIDRFEKAYADVAAYFKDVLPG